MSTLQVATLRENAIEHRTGAKWALQLLQQPEVIMNFCNEHEAEIRNVLHLQEKGWLPPTNVPHRIADGQTELKLDCLFWRVV